MNRFPFKAMKWEGIGGPLEKTWNTSVLDTYLDNINLLYVAFTRAEQQLFIYAKKKVEEKKKKTKKRDRASCISFSSFWNRKAKEKDRCVPEDRCQRSAGGQRRDR